MDFESQIADRVYQLRGQDNYRRLAPSEAVSFAHNDYLGLSGHPQIVEAGKRALEIFGTSSRGSRLLGADARIYAEVETRLAEFFGSPDALFFSSGYLANVSVLRVLGELCDRTFSDSLNHASLIDGIRQSGCARQIVPHGEWANLSGEHLSSRSLLVTESLFSMDGDLMSIQPITELWKKCGGFLLVDEAHAAGVMGPKGKGYWAPHISDWGNAAVTVTFGKAFGSGGAAVLCSQELKELIINRARSFIFTTAPSPVIPAMVLAALDVVESEGWRLQELWQRSESVRAALRQAAPEALIENRQDPIWADRSPIIPFLVSGPDRALRFSQSMRESGIELKAIRYPTVARGAERIRISLNLGVSNDNTDWMVKEVVKQWTAFLLQEQTQG